MHVLSDVVYWAGHSFLGVLLAFGSLVAALIAAIRATSANEQAKKAVSLVSAFDAVANLGAVKELFSNSKTAIRSKDWVRVAEVCDSADAEITRLLSSKGIPLSEKNREKLESVLEIARNLSSDADMAEERKKSMDSLKSRSQIRQAISSIVALQEELKGGDFHE